MLVLVLPVMLLTLHPAVGSSLYGAARWIDLGPITLQPAEFAKLLTVCAAAAILSRPWKDLDRPRDAFLPLGPLVAVVAAIVMLQKDLGTTVVICGSVFLLLFAAGLRLRYLAWTALGGVAAIAYFIFGTAYRKTRLLEAWLNWELDPSGAGWQLRQGLIALGSGGWLGIGLGNSRQKWDYLPNAHSDFVFAVLGEELGLIGALAVLSLFGILLFAGIRIAVNAPDAFGRLLAAGITGWIGLQTLVNLGAVTGLLPITGVPLPFLSFGGTALVVTLAGVASWRASDSTACGPWRGGTPRSVSSRRRGEPAVRIVIAGGGTAGHISPFDRGGRPSAGRRSDRRVRRLLGRTGGLDRAGRRLPLPSGRVRRRSDASSPSGRRRPRSSRFARWSPAGRSCGTRPRCWGWAGTRASPPWSRRGRSGFPRSCTSRTRSRDSRTVSSRRLATAMALTFEDSRERVPRVLRTEVTGLPVRREIWMW